LAAGLQLSQLILTENQLYFWRILVFYFGKT